MKLRSLFIPTACSGLLLLSSCDTKTPPAEGDVSAPAAETSAPAAEESSVAEKVTEVVDETVSKAVPMAPAADRVANLGFVQYLPVNTQAVLASYKGGDLVKRIRKSDIGTYLENLWGQSMGLEGADGPTLDDMADNPEAAMAIAALSEEVFLAVGAGTGEQSKNLLKISAAVSYFQMKAAVIQVESGLSGEADPEMLEAAILGQVTAFLKDPEAGMALLERAKMPPVLLGFKVSDEEMRNQLVGMLGGLMGQAMQDPEAPLEEVSVEQAGVKFNGFKVVGEKLAAMVGPEDRAEMAEGLGGEVDVDALIAALAKKDLVLMTGVKDSYILVSLSGAVEDVKLASGPGESVAANGDFSFMDGYLQKDIRFLTYGNQRLIADLLSGNAASSNSYLRGFADGLKDSKFFGDTTDIQVLLKHSMGLITKYYDQYEAQGGGLVGFLENGFKIESHGGHNYPGSDLKTQHKFADLGSAEKTFFFANWVNDSEMTALSLEILDSLGEAAYLMAKQASGLEVDNMDFRQFAQGFEMFDSKFAADLKKVWSAVRTDWAQGVGNEYAFLVDLDGGMPKVPMVPAPLVEQGKIPRITMVAPVEDRDLLKKSWVGLNEALTNLLKNISEMTGEEIPMQEPISSEADGKTTWFFTTIPFTSNDFLPNITVSDDHFIASTSKSLATSLDGRLEAKEIKRSGAYAGVNFSALWAYGREWINLVEKNVDQVFESEFERDNFRNNIPMVKGALDAMESIEHLSIHTREEEGKSRTSIHFRVK